MPSTFLLKSLVLNLGVRLSVIYLKLYITFLVCKNFSIERGPEFLAGSQDDP